MKNLRQFIKGIDKERLKHRLITVTLLGLPIIILILVNLKAW